MAFGWVYTMRKGEYCGFYETSMLIARNMLALQALKFWWPKPVAMSLRDLWLAAPPGRLCPWQQARALALREASRELHGRAQLCWIAARLEKVLVSHWD